MNPSIGKTQSASHIFLNQRYIHNVFERIICSLRAGGKRKKILKTSLSLLILFVLSITLFANDLNGSIVQASISGIAYGPERQISGEWIIDNETVVVTSEQPIYFAQDYHEQYKIIVKNGGVLKIIDSYICSDFRFLLELYDTSKLIVDNSNLEVQEGKGAVITNMDNSVIEAKNSQLDYVGIASGNMPLSYTTVDLYNCSISQLELDLFNMKGVVIEGLSTGNIEDRTFSSERFRMTLKNCVVKREITSWIGDAEVTFKNCKMGVISPDEGSVVNIENCTMREIAPRVSGYSGIISGLPQGNVSSFQLNLPATHGPSINVVNSTIENGWYFRYFSGCNIEFRNCHFSVLRPMRNNFASVYDSTVREVWIWWTSGEIYFQNSSIGWIGSIMGPNDILLSGDITVEDKNWRERPFNWGETIIRREFFFSLPSGSGDCVIENEEGIIVDQFVVGTTLIKKVLMFDQEQRNFEVYLNGTLKKTLELSSDANVIFEPNTYTIKASAGVEGSISPSGIVTINPGDSKAFTITPNAGYHIKDVKVDGVSVGAVSTYTFTNITSDHTIEATFEINSYTIKATAGVGGSIIPSGLITVNYGGSQTFEIYPDKGYLIKDVLTDGISIRIGQPNPQPLTSAKFTFENVTSNHAIEAIFKKEAIIIILKIGSKSFTVNGDQRTLDSPPIIKNGRTLVPIRAIIEGLNGTVSWDPNEKKVTVTLGSTKLELWIGKSTAKVNGVDILIDSTNSKVVPEIINSRTMLPLRFIAENLGSDVQWDGTTKTITITYPRS